MNQWMPGTCLVFEIELFERSPRFYLLFANQFQFLLVSFFCNALSHVPLLNALRQYLRHVSSPNDRMLKWMGKNGKLLDKCEPWLNSVRTDHCSICSRFSKNWHIEDHSTEPPVDGNGSNNYHTTAKQVQSHPSISNPNEKTEWNWIRFDRSFNWAKNKSAILLLFFLNRDRK